MTAGIRKIINEGHFQLHIHETRRITLILTRLTLMGQIRIRHGSAIWIPFGALPERSHRCEEQRTSENFHLSSKSLLQRPLSSAPMLQGLYDSGCLGSAVLCDGFGNDTEVNGNGFGESIWRPLSPHGKQHFDTFRT